MAKRRKKQPVAVARVSPQRVRQGWPGPDGITIRLVRPDEIDAVRKLVVLTGVELEDDTASAAADGGLARHLLAGLESSEALKLGVLEEVARYDMIEAAQGLTACLVAVDQEGRVLGTLVAVPPGPLHDQVIARGGSRGQAALTLIRAVKIRSVAVAEDARGRGYATALIKRALQMYWQAGFHLVFGQFSVGSGLEAFYSRFGFEVLEAGEFADLGSQLVGLAVGYGAGPGERFFFRWRQ